MTEFVERFLKAIEELAAAIRLQAEVQAKQFEPMSSGSKVHTLTENQTPAETQSGGPAEEASASKRKRRNSAAAPAENIPPAKEEISPSESPEEITSASLNALLRKIAVNPKLGLARAKQVFAENSGGAAKILDMDPGLYPGLDKACREVLADA